MAASRRPENLRLTLRFPSQPTYLSRHGDLVEAHARPAPDRHRCHSCLPHPLPARGRPVRGVEDDVLAPRLDALRLPWAYRHQRLLHDAALEVPAGGGELQG